jgi:hypothetical protein
MYACGIFRNSFLEQTIVTPYRDKRTYATRCPDVLTEDSCDLPQFLPTRLPGVLTEDSCDLPQFLPKRRPGVLTEDLCDLPQFLPTRRPDVLTEDLCDLPQILCTRRPDVLIEDSCDLPQFLHENAEIFTRFGDDCSYPNPFFFIIHESSYQQLMYNSGRHKTK